MARLDRTDHSHTFPKVRGLVDVFRSSVAAFMQTHIHPEQAEWFQNAGSRSRLRPLGFSSPVLTIGVMPAWERSRRIQIAQWLLQLRQDMSRE
eukprot:13005836-Alexandrium_andersonii.AAC.1